MSEVPRSTLTAEEERIFGMVDDAKDELRRPYAGEASEKIPERKLTQRQKSLAAQRFANECLVVGVIPEGDEFLEEAYVRNRLISRQ